MVWSVVLASALLFATAATFVAMGSIVYVRGTHAQAAAEAEVVRQGLPDDVLARGHVNFKDSGAELALPLLIAVVLSALAVFNLAGSQTVRVGTWVFQPILVLAGWFVTGQQLFAVRFVRSAFAKSGDDELARVDVDALMGAATRAFPSWFLPLVAIRFGLVTVGSIAVMLLLALPSASAHYQ